MGCRVSARARSRQSFFHVDPAAMLADGLESRPYPSADLFYKAKSLTKPFRLWKWGFRWQQKPGVAQFGVMHHEEHEGHEKGIHCFADNPLHLRALRVLRGAIKPSHPKKLVWASVAGSAESGENARL